MKTGEMNNNISVILPAFNEEENIEKAVLDIYNYLQKKFSEFEIIVVNDGSTDNTQKIVEKIIKVRNKIKIINHKKNIGYGAALRQGFKNAKYDLVFYTDSDNQFNILDLDRLLPFIKKYDIVAGYRINRQDPLMRIFIGWAYNLLINFLFNPAIKDIDCSFKLYKKKVFDKISLNSNTGLVDAEVLIKARKAGFSMTQISIRHYPRLKGKTVYVFGKQNRIFAFVRPDVILNIFREIKKNWAELR